MTFKQNSKLFLRAKAATAFSAS